MSRRKCCNCPANAEYEVNNPGANTLDYCYACMPPHYRKRADLGHYKKIGQFPVAEQAKKRQVIVDAANEPRRQRDEVKRAERDAPPPQRRRRRTS